MGVSGQLHASVALSPGKDLRRYVIGGWAGPRVDLDVLKKCLLPLPGFDPELFSP
jgi:hypothetical protein